ncbi:Hypp7798 [Branchiostoma lanceolatum]|uniref:Hypp7798 protein n=1 Tax=Branchiostoma lanceolatum TaxID=7740 RepID=A0A8J9Z3I0_BRALA|nr:Hypp7798 [Branchiostoma lanceolatum]
MTVLSAIISVVVPVPILLAFRACGNLVAAPGVVLVDICDTPFRLGTRFAAEVSFSRTFIGDVVLTVVFIGSLIVASWRGVWLLFDIFLFPTDQERSAWSSVAIGYGTLILLALLETPASRLLQKTRRRFARIVLEDVFKIAVWVGVLSVWRGFWLVCDSYILPDNPVQSYWITHGVGIGGLFLLQAGRSVLVAGCVVDGEAVDGSGVRMGRYLEQICPKLVRPSTEQVSNQRNHSDGGQQTTLPPQYVVQYETNL